MKKVLLAVDGTNFSSGAYSFIRQLNEKAPLLVAGIFVPQVEFSNLWSYSAAVGNGAVYVPLLEEEENDDVLKNIRQFEKLCQENGILYRVHKNFFNFALPVLKEESRYADVMVLSGELFYKQFLGNNQFAYIRTAVHDAECPVLIVPETGELPTSVILAYDGSEDSVFAIKQFAYIFPELASLPTLLVYAGEDDKDLPAKEEIMELVTQHYKDLTVYRLHIEPKKFFSAWMESQAGAILVSGALHRSLFSQAIKKSFAADVIENHLVPVFVAHR